MYLVIYFTKNRQPLKDLMINCYITCIDCKSFKMQSRTYRNHNLLSKYSLTTFCFRIHVHNFDQCLACSLYTAAAS